MTSRKLQLLPLALPVTISLAGSLQAATVTSVASGEWDDPATWDSAAAAPVEGEQGTGDDYVIADGFTVTSNNTGSNSQALIAQSLAVQGGGVLDLARLHGEQAQTVAWNLPAISLEEGATLQFRASLGTSNHSLAANLATAGAVTLNNTGGGYGQDINYTGVLSGSGTLSYRTAASGSAVATRTLALKTPDSPFTGNWFVQHLSGTSNDFATLRADAANALGTGSVTLDVRSQLVNNTTGGLDSVGTITLQQPDSTAALGSGWTNPAGVLNANNGTVTLGSGTSFGTASIATLNHGFGFLQFDLGSNPAEADKIIVSGDYIADEGSPIDIRLTANPGTGTYDLITYGGTFTGTPDALVVSNSRLVPNISYGDGSNDKVTVSFTGSTANLVWKGNDATSPDTWDVQTTANFDNGGAADTFYDLDSVTFDDTAASFAPSVSGTVAPGAVTFNNSANDYTLAGAGITGGGSITKNGTAALTLGSANSHTGGITLNEGRLRLGNNGAPGSGTLTLNGGKLSSDSTTARTISAPIAFTADFTMGDATDTGGLTFSGPVDLAGDVSVTAESGSANTVSGIIGGTGNIEIKRAANFQALWNWTNAGNDFAGDITLTSGRLRFNPNGANSDTALGNPANKIIFNGEPVETLGNGQGTASMQVTSGQPATIAATREVVLNEGKEGTFYTWGGQLFTVNAAITGAGTLRKEDGGTLLLTAANTYTGGTKIAMGIVRATNDSAFGTGDVTIGASGSTTSRIDLEGVTVENNFVLNSTAVTGFFGPLTAGGGTLSTVNGSVTISAAVGNGGHLASNGAGSVLRINGPIIVPNATIPNVRQGVVELGGGGSYPRLDVGEGTLRLAADNGISQVARLRLSVSNPTVFDLNGFDQTLEQLERGNATKAANVTNTGATASALTIDGAVDHSYSGTMDDGTGGLSLVKDGSGVFSLTGTATYTGSTTVNGGKLAINAAHGILDLSPVAVNAGGTLGGTGPVNGEISVAGTLAPGNSAGILVAYDTVTFSEGSAYAWEIADWTGTEAGTAWDLLDAREIVFTATPANKLTIAISGDAANFTESGKTFEIARSTDPVTGFDPAAIEIDDSAFAGSGTWTVQLNGNSVELVYTAGSGTPYSNWAAANGIPGATADEDSDGDGVANGIEFVIGGDPSGPGSDSNALLPTVATDAEFVSFTFRRTDEAAGENPYVQYSLTLDGTWTDAETGVNGVTVEEINNGFGTGIDSVTVKVPRSLAVDGKIFLRLAVDAG